MLQLLFTLYHPYHHSRTSGAIWAFKDLSTIIVTTSTRRYSLNEQVNLDMKKLLLASIIFASTSAFASIETKDWHDQATPKA